MSRLFTLLACLCGILMTHACAQSVSPLTTVAEARALPFDEASFGRAIDVEGIVTYFRDIPTDLNFSVHDHTGGIMVYPIERHLVRPGQRVRVWGITAMSVHGLRIAQARFETGPTAELPKPLRVSMAEVREGRFEGEYAEMEGIVRTTALESPEVKPRRLVLNFGSRSQRLSVWVSEYTSGYDWIRPGMALRIRGVVMRWKNPRGQTQNINVLANSLHDVQVVAGPVEAAEVSIDQALSWDGAESSVRPMRVTGSITYREQGGSYFVIQAGGHGIRIRPSEALDRRLQVGVTVTATGFATLGEYTTEIEDAQVATHPGRCAITPETYSSAVGVLRAERLVDRDARLITVEGILRNARERDDGLQALELQSEARTFTATLPSDTPLPENVRAGSRLRLTGVCSLHLTAERRRINRLPDTFSLALRGLNDIAVLVPGPWWTTRRLQFALVLGGVAMIVLASWAAILWQSNLRLRLEVQAREAAERKLTDERRRVASELHDTLEQTLTAASLQLNAAARLLLDRPTAAAPPVSMAVNLIGRSRQEVRDAVWDLRLDQTAEANLSTVLARLCKESSATVPVDFCSNGEESPKPAHLVAQFVRIVREAINNALKHGAPTRVEVHLEHSPDQLNVTVSDDGAGFDLDAASGPDTGHFGLLGLEERSQRLGGSISVSSRPGAGTIIRLQVPIRPSQA